MIQVKQKLKEFKSIMNTITNLGLETNLTFMPTGIFVRIVNSSNIAMIITTINSSLFEEYKVEQEKTYTVDNIALMKCINKIGKVDLSMDVLPTGIQFSNSRKDKLLLNYYVGQKDERKVPMVLEPVSWEINPGTLINELGESVEFGNIGIFSGKDALVLGIKSHLVTGDLMLDATKIEGNEYKSYYDMGEFIYISMIRHIFDKVKFSYNKDLCCISGISPDIDFKWILAARVDDDE